jgi:hypothetical protein
MIIGQTIGKVLGEDALRPADREPVILLKNVLLEVEPRLKRTIETQEGLLGFVVLLLVADARQRAVEEIRRRIGIVRGRMTSELVELTETGAMPSSANAPETPRPAQPTTRPTSRGLADHARQFVITPPLHACDLLPKAGIRLLTVSLARPADRRLARRQVARANG